MSVDAGVLLSSAQAGGVSSGSSFTLGDSQDSSVSCLTMSNIIFNGFSTGVLLGDGVQSKDDVCKAKVKAALTHIKGRIFSSLSLSLFQNANMFMVRHSKPKPLFYQDPKKTNLPF